MKTIAVIPARLGSTRLPAKALAQQTGKYLIQHVYERAAKCRLLDEIIIATDDNKIIAAARSFGANACMTRIDHRSGTDRVGEVAAAKGLSADDIVLNVQGDEPDVTADVLDGVITHLREGKRQGGWRIATPAARFSDNGPKQGPGSPADPNRVKVVLAHDGRALYFSRSIIPYPRSSGGAVEQPSKWLLHLGVYAFRADTLATICGGGGAVPPSDLEQAESLEQLRWLQAGLAIGVVEVQHSFIGIDTPEDYAAFVQRTKD